MSTQTVSAVEETVTETYTESVVETVQAEPYFEQEVQAQAPEPESSQDEKGKKRKTDTDESKRLFLRLAGVAGLGMVAATMLPKKAEAYVLGSSPTTGVVGMKNSSNVRIDPATETTLSGIKTKSDKLTFDVSNNLQVGGDIGIQNAANVVINPATEESLTAIKTQTNKFTFDGSGNLLTAGSGASTITGLKDTTSTQINPATDDAIVYLRRMVKLMESQATVDAGNRQRITIDSLGTGTAVTTTIPVSGTVTATVSLSAGANAIGSITGIDGQNRQMFQDWARQAYNSGIRQQLITS